MNRNNTIKIRVSDDEKASILKCAEKARMNISTYIRNSALQDKVVIIDNAALYKLLSSLRMIGSNINQIAKVANSTGALYSADMKDIRKEFDTLQADVTRFIAEMKVA